MLKDAAPAPVLTAASLQLRCIAESLAAASDAVRGQTARIAALRAEMAEVQ
jgi:hypothetical protein